MRVRAFREIIAATQSRAHHTLIAARVGFIGSAGGPCELL